MAGPTAVYHNQTWLTLLVIWVLYSSGLVEWHMTQVFEITKFFQSRFKPLCCEINTEIQCFKIIIMAGISSRKSKIQCKGRKPSWLNSRVYLGVFQQNWPLNHKKIHKWLYISIILLMNNKRQYSPDQRNGTLWFNCNWSVWMKLSHAYCIHQWCNSHSLSLSLRYQNIKFYTRFTYSTYEKKNSRNEQTINKSMTISRLRRMYWWTFLYIQVSI